MQIVAAVTPAHILRQNARLSGTVEHALTRAVQLAYNKWKPKWSEEEFVLKNPTADDIVAGLASMAGRAVAFDVETDGNHPKECALRCVGFFDGHTGIIVPLLYRDGEREDVPVMDRKGVTKMENHAVWKPYFKGEALGRVLKAMQDLLCGAPVLAQTSKQVAAAKQLPAKKAARVVKSAVKAKKSAGAPADASPSTWEEAQKKFSRSPKQAAFVYTQNGQYDRLVMRAVLGLDIAAGDSGFTFDTIVAHHVIAPYLPHKLGFLAALYTEAPYYKASEDGEAWSASTDDALWRYCLRDVKATWLAGEQMRQEISEVYPNAETVFLHDTWQEAQCERWKDVGIELDRATLRYFRHHYMSVRDKALAAMRELLAEVGLKSDDENFKALLEKLMDKASVDDIDDPDGSGRTIEVFNPGSLIELRMMLQGLKIPLNEVTATGQLSTAKELLTAARKELLQNKVPATDPRIAFLDYLFAWRESAKVVGTYLYPEVLRDGRVHPNFNVHVVPTGRLSSSGPNFQNQPAEIRGMFVAREGHVLISMDWDALEMRLGAFLSQDPFFIEVFRKYDAKQGPKPHYVNMGAIFNLPPTKEAAEQNPGMYRAAKVFAYAVAYGAGEDTVFEQVREELPDMTWEDFQQAYANYKKTYPKLFAFQRDVVKQGTKRGYIDSGLMGRRIFFFEKAWGESSPEATAMQNAPYQSTGADVVGAANKRIMERLVLPLRNGTHPTMKLLKRGDKHGNVIQLFDEVCEQLAQVHDELVFEVPLRIADEFSAECKRIAEELPKKLNEHGEWVELDWNLPVDIHHARRWKPVNARCGSAIESKDAKGRKVVGKCRELLEVELTKTTDEFERWEGECSHGHKKCIDVPYARAA